jgi:hypothetical protein
MQVSGNWPLRTPGGMPSHTAAAAGGAQRTAQRGGEPSAGSSLCVPTSSLCPQAPPASEALTWLGAALPAHGACIPHASGGAPDADAAKGAARALATCVDRGRAAAACGPLASRDEAGWRHARTHCVCCVCTASAARPGQEGVPRVKTRVAAAHTPLMQHSPPYPSHLACLPHLVRSCRCPWCPTLPWTHPLGWLGTRLWASRARHSPHYRCQYSCCQRKHSCMTAGTCHSQGSPGAHPHTLQRATGAGGVPCWSVSVLSADNRASITGCHAHLTWCR